MSIERDVDVGWWFEKQPPGQSWNPGLLTKKTLDRSVETFVRETLQNINDQGPVDEDEPVRARFRLEKLSKGDGLEEFVEAVDWDTLREHVEAAAEEQDGSGISDYIEYVKDEEELPILVVEGRNTTGIRGGESERASDYAGLVRDMGRSFKEEGAGGRHGLGKTVLWAASGIQTVLFASNLHGDDEEKSPRLVGRTYFPTHEMDSGCYDGQGWFGDLSGTDDPSIGRPTSVWDENAKRLTDALSFDRPDDPGTSAMVLGFRDPSDPSMDEQPEAGELADQFETAAVEFFWPAIRRGELEVSIEIDDDRRVLTAENIADRGAVTPFVACYDEYFEAPEALEGPGSVAAIDIPYEIVSKKDENTPTDGYVTLCVRRATPNDEEKVGEVAMFRGSKMVVSYKEMHHLGVDQNVHAILICGRGRAPPGEDPTPADDAIEEFLLSAEPPAHDEWYGRNNDELKGKYESGCVGAVRKLTRRLLRDNLVELLASETERSGETRKPNRDILPQTRANRNRGETTSTPSPGSASLFDFAADGSLDDGKWSFEGHVGPDREEHAEWSVSASLAAMTEDNTEADEIPIDVIRCEDGDATCSVEGGKARIEADADTNRVDFEVSSIRLPGSDLRTGDAVETKFKIEEGEIRLGGEE